MEVISPRCCGWDVHKRGVVACAVITGPAGMPSKTIRAFGTMTPDILALADWLTAHEVTHVAMERTGVSWKPLWNLLEERCDLLVVNARHGKAVPGRKTDVRDGAWVAAVLRHGLLTGSFVPDRPHRELRELTRYRTSLVRERTAEANRLQKTLEGANITLAAVATDILGKSGREMLAALVAGETDSAELAQLAQGRLREKIPQLERALVGRVGPHQRFLVAEHLAPIDVRAAAMARIGAGLAARVRPDADAIARLDTIPGVGRSVAEALVADIGANLERFPTATHLASGAGRCPGHHERGGKRRSGRTRKGSPWLRAGLIQAAHAAARTKGASLAAQDRRLAARSGRAKAAVAVAHSILVIVSHRLTEGTVSRDLGANSCDERDRQAVERRLGHRLEGLGDTVSLTPAAWRAAGIACFQTRLGRCRNLDPQFPGCQRQAPVPYNARNSRLSERAPWPRGSIAVLCRGQSFEQGQIPSSQVFLRGQQAATDFVIEQTELLAPDWAT